MRLRENLAKNVWQLRQERAMSQDDFAALIGIHRTYLNHIEHAKRAPTIDVIERMMAALNLPVTALLGEPPEKR
jgi:transcriptional regulator with XRE-family HTH domain